MLAKSSLVVFAALLLHAVSSFAFQIIMGRSLSLDQFGQLSVLLSVQAAFAVPSGALIIHYSRSAAALNASGRRGGLGALYRASWGTCVRWALAAAALVYAGAFFLRDELRVDAPAAFVSAPMVAAYFMQVPGLALVRGLGSFNLFAAGLGGGGALKVLLALAVVAAGWADGASAVGAITASALFSVALLHLLLRGGLSESHPDPGPAPHRPQALFLASAMAGAFFPVFFMSVDMVLVRYYFPPDVSGHYGAFGVVGKVFTLLSQVLAIAMFPAVVTEDTAGRGAPASLAFKGMGILTAAGLPAVAFCFLFGDGVLRMIIKTDDPATAACLGYYAVSALAVGILYVEAAYQLARRRFGFVVAGVAGALFQTAGIAWFSGSLPDMVKFQAVLFWALAAWRMAAVALEKTPSPAEG